MKPTSTLILIVEDDEDIRELLTVFLEAEGYRVSLTANGLDAWKQLQTGLLPALILLDWMMPQMDGEQFLTKLRACRFAKLPVIVMSGNDTSTEKARALKAMYCLKKPVELDELLNAVNRFVLSGPKNAA